MTQHGGPIMLGRKEESLQLAIEGAELGTWDWDIGTGELIWSDRSCALSGLQPGTPLDYAAVREHLLDRSAFRALKLLSLAYLQWQMATGESTGDQAC